MIHQGSHGLSHLDVPQFEALKFSYKISSTSCSLIAVKSIRKCAEINWQEHTKSFRFLSQVIPKILQIYSDPKYLCVKLGTYNSTFEEQYLCHLKELVLHVADQKMCLH
jgi:hypothetical protein